VASLWKNVVNVYEYSVMTHTHTHTHTSNSNSGRFQFINFYNLQSQKGWGEGPWIFEL